MPGVRNGRWNRCPPLACAWTYQAHPANMARLYPGTRAKEKAKSDGWRGRQRGYEARKKTKAYSGEDVKGAERRNLNIERAHAQS
jgi:hypothetical protein